MPCETPEEALRFARAIAVLLVAASFAAAKEPVRVEIPFETVHGLIIVRAAVAESAGDFVLDTGAEMTTVDREFLGLKKKAAATGAAPSAIVSGLADVGQLCVGARCFGKWRVGLTDFSAVSANAGRKLAGMIGQDVLREFDCVGIDYRRGVIVLTKNGGV